VLLNGYAIKEIRTKAGKTVSAAAKGAGVSQPTWSNWERGERNATAANLLQIVKELEIGNVRAILANPDEIDLSELAS
jgi:transcriptional regulator with XRE-family HTH domain